MLTEPVPIDGRDVIVGMKIRVVYHDGDLRKTREGRITKITGDSLATYLWVGTKVIAVIPKSPYSERALMDYEIWMLEDFMTEEQHALSRAMLDAGLMVSGNKMRKVLWELERLGFTVAKFPKPPMQPKPVVRQEVQARRPAP